MRTITIRGDVAPEGRKAVLEFYDGNGIDILDEEGQRALFYLRVTERGELEISTGGMHAHHGGRLLAPGITVRPQDSGRVLISRDEYQP